MLYLVLLIGIVVGLFYIVGFIQDKEAENIRKQDPKRRELLEAYTMKKNLFLQFKEYLYKNIEEFENIENIDILRARIEQDFPNYGNGIHGGGVFSDLYYHGDLIEKLSDFSRNQYDKNFILGDTFQIISIAYPNFKIFCNQIYNSEYKMRYFKGGYYSDFGDDIKQIIFYIELNQSKFYIGLSKGGYDMNYYEKRHKNKTDEDKMYLFFELEMNNYNTDKFPYFNQIELRKDISVKEYHNYFTLHIEKCKNLI